MPEATSPTLRDMNKLGGLKPVVIAAHAKTDIVAITDELLKKRFSCRYFLSHQVPKATIEEIIDTARFSPSGNNIQPWEKVYCVSGNKLAAISDEVLVAFQTDAGSYTAQYEYYPPMSSMPSAYLERRQEFGRSLGETLSIERNDVAGRMKAAGRNYQFYNAPMALLFTINKDLRQGSWLDVGYFLQSISIAACARGLETISQESIAQYQAILRRHLPIGDDEIVAVGMAVGYPDVELATRFEMPRQRRAVSDIVTFYA